MKKIYACRKTAKLSQTYMAKLLGINLQTYSRKEMGKAKWKSDEMEIVLEEIRKTAPNVTYNIFFEDVVLT